MIRPGGFTLTIVWPKKKKTEEKRKIEFQSKRRKREKPRTADHLDPSLKKGKTRFLQSNEIEKKKRRKKERKGRKRRKKEEKNRNSGKSGLLGQKVQIPCRGHIDYLD